ncbi:hypothetical protein [Sinosporangium siamense]|uniref:Secreted protein n=1 Tax=Sinosporangium siamense TaxID=1367973 RepID=A0A919VAS0_9ACTN|nr:hypothetical protein [Sinosporangium siamense]GII96781.1 hypothetical protein Ssi02_70120 [Sinosporangium siamense]
MIKLFRSVLVPIAVVIGVLAAVAPAPAAATHKQNFTVCFKNSDCNMGFTTGTIDWVGGPNVDGDGLVIGKVVNRANSDYSTTVVYEAYVGDNKRHSTTRTVKDGSKTITPFHFSRPVNRIKITVCQNFRTGKRCGTPKHYSH